MIHCWLDSFDSTLSDDFKNIEIIFKFSKNENECLIWNPIIWSKGVFSFADNSVYEGNLICKEISGKGCYKWSDRKMYDGDWENNKQQGCTLVWK